MYSKNNSVVMTLYLYSKYSEASRYLMQFVANSHFIQKLCIDNPDVKKQIIDSKVQITKVPCILVYHTVGTVEMFEGMKAFEWVNCNIYPLPMFNPPPQPTSHPQPQYSSIQAQDDQTAIQASPQTQSQQPQQNATATPIGMIPFEEEEEKVERVQPDKKGDSVKARAEELERARNTLLFKEPPNMTGGLKPGGPTTDTITTSIRQK